MKKDLDTQIKNLLLRAKKELYRDIEKEVEQLSNSNYPQLVNQEKYESVKNLFQQILSLDPNNSEAKKGLQACFDMLEIYIPIQHLMPINADNAEMLKIKKTSDQENHMLPWEIRRARLDKLAASDKAGMQYTAKIFSESTKKAQEKVEAIIIQAKNEILSGKDPDDIFKVTEEKLIEYQEQLNRSWKGHGPLVLDDALKELREEIDKFR